MTDTFGTTSMLTNEEGQIQRLTERLRRRDSEIERLTAAFELIIREGGADRGIWSKGVALKALEKSQ